MSRDEKNANIYLYVFWYRFIVPMVKQNDEIPEEINNLPAASLSSGGVSKTMLSLLCTLTI